jgi:hypothetical protein
MTQLCVGVDVHGVVATAEEDEVTPAVADLRFTAFLSTGPQPVDVRYLWIVSN